MDGRIAASGASRSATLSITASVTDGFVNVAARAVSTVALSPVKPQACETSSGVSSGRATTVMLSIPSGFVYGRT